jgi:hypothetical protein
MKIVISKGTECEAVRVLVFWVFVQQHLQSLAHLAQQPLASSAQHSTAQSFTQVKPSPQRVAV